MDSCKLRESSRSTLNKQNNKIIMKLHIIHSKIKTWTNLNNLTYKIKSTGNVENVFSSVNLGSIMFLSLDVSQFLFPVLCKP